MFLLLTLGWFALAYLQIGPPLISKMIGEELIGHAVRDEGGALPGQGFYKPTLYFLIRFAPWSLLACAGFWSVWKRPAENDKQRRFERFLCCYFLVGLVIFSLAPHQRADHLFPLLPAAALLGARELVRLSPPPNAWAPLATIGGAALVLAPLAFYYYHHRRPHQELVKQTIGMRRLAARIQRETGGDLPLLHVDAPFALQFFLQTMEPAVTVERARYLLRCGDPIYVAVSTRWGLDKYLGIEAGPARVIAGWPNLTEPEVCIVSNRPLLGSREPRAEGKEPEGPL